MTTLSVAQVALGFAVILFTLFDAFVTILSLRGGGPATSFISRKIWRLMLVMHRAKPSHKLLSVSGPVLMVLVVLFWYGMLNVGWFLIFHSADTNIINSNSLTSASGLETLYFTGVTLSGLGYGDFTASGFPWTLYSTAAVSTATLLTSLGLSYIISVVPVALEKRQLAHQINSVVSDQSTLIKRLREPSDVAFIWEKLFSIQLNGTKFSTKYGAYPVVAYFHASEAVSSFSLAYLKASDILFYIANHPSPELRPPVTAVATIKHLITSHSKNLEHIIDKREPALNVRPERYEPLAVITELSSADFSWEEYQKLRDVLVTACLYDGW
ncbi:hypothetical protein [uncultured Gilvimarinus sp.]|uniref:hypothetical protein n=1 Tax=uncultured Gilvimarinus sp. TaxID=1689143 RepID=UPI0030D7E7A0